MSPRPRTSVPPLLALLAASACTVLQHEPTQVDVQPAAALRTGDDATCALLDNGNVGCWGANRHGELGRLPSEGALAIPTYLPLDADPSDLAIGPAHGCGVFDGAVSCWGENADGLLGGDAGCLETGSYGACPSGPVAVAGLVDQTQVVVASRTTVEYDELPRPWSCALGADGRARCWGDDTAGQLASDPTGAPTGGARLVPDDVFDADGFPLRDLVQLAAHDDRACAVDQAGALWCWGGGARGAQRLDRPPVAAIAVGDDHDCALLASGGVMCWGDNTNGQAGDVDAAYECDPELGCIVGPTVVDIPAATAVAGGRVHSCARTTAGAVTCWGSNQTVQLGVGNAGLISEPVTVALPAKAVAIAAGRMHTCALGERGEVWCWGDDSSGQVGVPE